MLPVPVLKGQLDNFMKRVGILNVIDACLRPKLGAANTLKNFLIVLLKVTPTLHPLQVKTGLLARTGLK
jgi:hypothetical protein